MSLSALALSILAILAVGYVVYGRFIARQYNLDDQRTTPAVAKNDGVDFVPTKPFYLLGQHFSAIAAAGPIVGPIAACMVFGWLPCVLWIVIGVVFIGAVHDLSALVASVRHGAHSIADIARHNLGRRAYLAIVAFIWISLLYVITAFTDVTALNFVGNDPELQAIQGDFNRGGAVAASSVLYLALALVLGLVQWKLRPPMWLVTLIFVPATFAMVWLGTKMSNAMVFDIKVWHAGILGYCFVASLLPLWLLQQPRGYLGGFVLYVSLALGVVGLLFGGFKIEQPAIAPGNANIFSWFAGGDAGSMSQLIFPFLFVTIACGACSGFHGLVCGGTTSKQISKESHCTPIAFGAMLMEGFVAIIALATVMIVTPDKAKAFQGAPGVLYGEGLARFFAAIFGDRHMIFAKTFGTMVIATFV
ncbi:MAG: carbon starvation protein A, partial [Phycisphaerae bacterium]|nr:carbon starvation protein A [Phycisphaerae bacterium]